MTISDLLFFGSAICLCCFVCCIWSYWIVSTIVDNKKKKVEAKKMAESFQTLTPEQQKKHSERNAQQAWDNIFGTITGTTPGTSAFQKVREKAEKRTEYCEWLEKQKTVRVKSYYRKRPRIISEHK